MFSASSHTVCQREPICYKIYLVPTSAFHFLQVLFIWRAETRANQGAPINLVEIYFYFDLSPWFFKGNCRGYWFCFLSASGKQRRFMKAVIIAFRYRSHWWEDEGLFVVYGMDGFLLGNSNVYIFFYSHKWEQDTHIYAQYDIPECQSLED